jgi:hypothetical protein
MRYNNGNCMRYIRNSNTITDMDISNLKCWHGNLHCKYKQEKQLAVTKLVPSKNFPIINCRAQKKTIKKIWKKVKKKMQWRIANSKQN